MTCAKNKINLPEVHRKKGVPTERENKSNIYSPEKKTFYLVTFWSLVGRVEIAIVVISYDFITSIIIFGSFLKTFLSCPHSLAGPGFTE